MPKDDYVAKFLKKVEEGRERANLKKSSVI